MEISATLPFHLKRRRREKKGNDINPDSVFLLLLLLYCQWEYFSQVSVMIIVKELLQLLFFYITFLYTICFYTFNKKQFIFCMHLLVISTTMCMYNTCIISTLDLLYSKSYKHMYISVFHACVKHMYICNYLLVTFLAGHLRENLVCECGDVGAV